MWLLMNAMNVFVNTPPLRRDQVFSKYNHMDLSLNMFTNNPYVMPLYY